MGEDDIRITLIDSQLIQDRSIYAASYLVKKHRLKPVGKKWHDDPRGEYLVLGHIPSNAFLGTTTYKAIYQHLQVLLPELADKPSQLMESLRKYYHGRPDALVRAGYQDTPRNRQLTRYKAARGISDAFETRKEGFLIALMCLSFRRQSQPLDWTIVAANFTGINIKFVVVHCNVLTQHRVSGLTLQQYGARLSIPPIVARTSGMAAAGRANEG